MIFVVIAILIKFVLVFYLRKKKEKQLCGIFKRGDIVMYCASRTPFYMPLGKTMIVLS